MASLKIKFLATSIRMQMHLQVFLPESIAQSEPDGGVRIKALWLLHGEGGDCSDWVRLSMVEHYAQAANIALVMPNLDNSMFMDMAHGGYPYFTYLIEELPRHLRGLVRVLSDRRSDNFVAGVGVGGYGAIKWMLRAPDMFAAGACLSGEIDTVAALRDMETKGRLGDAWKAAFGDAARIAGTDDDVMHLAQQRAKAGAPQPTILFAGSDRDEGAVRSRAAAGELKALGVDLRFYEDTSLQGWPLWDARIRDFIGSVMTADGRVEA